MQRCLRYMVIFNIATFGHETWSSKSSTYTPSLPHVVEFELIFALWTTSSEIQINLQNCHIWASNVAIGESFRSCTYTLFLPQAVIIELIFALWTTAFEIHINLQNYHTWASNLAIGHSTRSCTYSLFLPQGVKMSLFSLYGHGFWDTGEFSKLPYLGMKLGLWPKFQKLHIYSHSTPRGRNRAYFCSMGHN